MSVAFVKINSVEKKHVIHVHVGANYRREIRSICQEGGRGRGHGGALVQRYILTASKEKAKTWTKNKNRIPLIQQ